MRKIVIVYHAYLYGNGYMGVILEQLRKITNAIPTPDGGLEPNIFTLCDKLYIGVVDDPNKKPAHGVEWIKTWYNFSSSKKKDEPNPKVEVVIYPDNLELRRTLWWMRDYAKENPDDYILFFHSKGITHNNEAVHDWRRYMEYFCIERWEDCVAKLDEGYDCCGVLWNKETPIGYFPHFSGAFFWAKCSYINTLNHNYIDSAWRYHMEFWIGSNPNAKVYEMHNSGYNTTERLIASQGHYHIRYPRENYVSQ